MINSGEKDICTKHEVHTYFIREYKTTLTLKTVALGHFQASLLFHQQSPQCSPQTEVKVFIGKLTHHSKQCTF